MGFYSEHSAWSHGVLWRERTPWSFRAEPLNPKSHHGEGEHAIYLLGPFFLSTSVPCGINFPVLPVYHLFPLGNHLEKTESHGSRQLGLGAAVIVTSTTKGSMQAETTGGVRGNDLGFMWLSCQEGCRAEHRR